jgi:uncharacterized membrane protein YhaH (DUF805 family)
MFSRLNSIAILISIAYFIWNIYAYSSIISHEYTESLALIICSRFITNVMLFLGVLSVLQRRWWGVAISSVWSLLNAILIVWTASHRYATNIDLKPQPVLTLESLAGIFISVFMIAKSDCILCYFFV